MRKRETIINQPPRQPNHNPSSNHRKDLRKIPTYQGDSLHPPHLIFHSWPLPVCLNCLRFSHGK